MSLSKQVRNWEANLRARYNRDLSTPENRRRAHIYNLFFDHAILRGIWKNMFEIAPGVFRSNHPTHARFARMKAAGIRTVINLRGVSESAHYWTEEETCRALGLNLVSTTLYARNAASRDDTLNLIAIFPSAEKPFTMHCKSGADRAGFASAIYLMAIEGQPVSQARKMLSPRFFHLRLGPVAILDYILDVYEAHTKRTPISFEDWVKDHYDPVEIEAAFSRKDPVT